MRKTFAVGRLTPKTTEIVMVREEDADDRERPPFPGPWTLEALVRARRPPTAHATSRAVH